MNNLKEKVFAFTKESNQEEITNWKKAIRAIPLKLSVDEDVVSSEVGKAEVKIEVAHLFYELGEGDALFFLCFLFKAGNIVRILIKAYYNVGKERVLFPEVISFLKKYGLPEPIELDSIMEIKNTTWQESYDLLSRIAEDEKIPVYPVV